MNAKELARIYIDVVKYEDGVDVSNKPTKYLMSGMDIQANEKLDEIFTHLYDELISLHETQKRPFISAFEQVRVKSHSIITRINQFYGYDVIEELDFFMCWCCKQIVDIENQKLDTTKIKYGDKLYAALSDPKYKNIIDPLANKGEQQLAREEALKDFVPHVVRPLKSFIGVDKSEAVREILDCLAALARYNAVGIPITCFKPLAAYIAFLQYIVGITPDGETLHIDEDIINEFEADRDKFIFNLRKKGLI